MKKIVFIVLVFCFCLRSSAQTFSYQEDYPSLYKSSKDAESSFYYENLKNRFISEGEKFSKEEVIALLAGQTAQESYNAYGMVGLEKSFLAAEQFPADTILKYGEKVLEINPIDFSLNFGLWRAHVNLGNSIEASKYQQRFQLIAESILSTGDGTKEHPYFVISPIDGFVIITKYYEKAIGKMGSGEDSNGYFLDILEMGDGTDKKTLHFVIDHGMGALSKILSEIK
jgi:hypothetical protein